MRSPGPLFAFILALTMGGCRSAYVVATISNHTPEPLSLIEVDYPSASFGTQTLAPGQDFHYRFKVQGSGVATIAWTDAQHRDQRNSGPSLREGDEGKLNAIFNSQSSATWVVQLRNRAAGN